MLVSFEGTVKGSRETPKAEKNVQIMKKIAKWVVISSLPSSTVEDTELLRLVQILDMAFKLPSQTTTSRRLREMPASERIRVQGIIDKVPG